MLTAIDTNALPWEERPNERIGRSLYRKNLIEDPDTGMEIRLVRYPAGIINPSHTHPCGHGMYVLEGALVTHEGQFGPGHFVWFPEGSVMEHGAWAAAMSPFCSSPTNRSRSTTGSVSKHRSETNGRSTILSKGTDWIAPVLHSNSAQSLKNRIAAARKMMIRGRYVAEAGWLVRIDGSPDSCGTTGARRPSGDQSRGPGVGLPRRGRLDQ